MATNISLDIGTKLSDTEGWPAGPVRTLSDMFPDLHVGDLVVYNHTTRHSGLVVYRIDKDCPPQGDAVWGEYCTPRRYRWSKGAPQRVATSFIYPGTRTKVPKIRLRGCIEIRPVFQLLHPGNKPLKHTVAYSQIMRRVRRVEILDLAKSFADFQDFIKAESKLLSGT